eukprot:TRINITY_DN19706_c0_g1_i1.p1 TRINITY_DN19706_c0_g1~~TRINITY_DN19706_c0_g1_i1.p1  ORF type:complete len:285 (+),score=40.08 TRINITY_DN19706_c0_g1_i1:91-945(+)
MGVIICLIMKTRTIVKMGKRELLEDFQRTSERAKDITPLKKTAPTNDVTTIRRKVHQLLNPKIFKFTDNQRPKESATKRSPSPKRKANTTVNFYREPHLRPFNFNRELSIDKMVTKTGSPPRRPEEQRRPVEHVEGTRVRSFNLSLNMKPLINVSIQSIERESPRFATEVMQERSRSTSQRSRGYLNMVGSAAKLPKAVPLEDLVQQLSLTARDKTPTAPRRTEQYFLTPTARKETFYYSMRRHNDTRNLAEHLSEEASVIGGRRRGRPSHITDVFSQSNLVYR